ncbi:MAG: hypothetical protein Q4G44_06400 [Alcaligenaceae bacterium]|nr:hypothetical protein [Alcaligenaceae bacterium]
MAMEYLISLLIFVVSRWWLFLPLVLGVFYVLYHFHLVSTKSYGGLLTVFVICALVSIFSRMIFAPVINYYGKLAVGEVTASRATMFSDASYDTVYSVKATFEAEDGSKKKLSYWDSVHRVYPVFKGYGIPTSEKSLFVLKYLPLMHSEFVFIAKFSDKDKRDFCPLLKDKLSELQAKSELLSIETTEFNQVFFHNMPIDEQMALQRKIRRGKNLTEAEQRKKELDEQTHRVFREIGFLKMTVESSDYCDE